MNEQLSFVAETLEGAEVINKAGDDVTAMFKFAEAQSIRRAAIRAATE